MKSRTKLSQSKFNSSFLVVLFSLLLVTCYLSCETLKKQEEKLEAPRSTKEIRLDDIREQVTQNPVKAIDLIWTFRAVYGSVIKEKETEELVSLEKEAADNLMNLLEKAMAEEQWDDAASYSRSLFCLQEEPLSVSEMDIILSEAKKKLTEERRQQQER